MIRKYWYIFVMLVMGLGFGIYHYIQSNKISKLQAQNSVLIAVNDTLRVYKNKLGSLTYEKQAINVKYTDLKKMYDLLDRGNKELFDKMTILEKKNKLITATNIKQSATIDSLLNLKPVEVSPNLFQFKDSTKYLQYSMFFNTSIPKSPTLLIDKINIPNSIYVSHKFEKDKIIVSVSNSNDLYYRVNDINSYIIPIEAKKNKSHWLKYGLIGFGGGILIMLLK